MEQNLIRLLKADEIECRVQSSTDKGAVLLIYKTARVDYSILDEVVGVLNWKIEYKEIFKLGFKEAYIYFDSMNMLNI